MDIRYVHCTLAAGYFENEFYVNVGNCSAIVDRMHVSISVEPRQNREGQGFVHVYVIKQSSDQFLVEIPGEPVVGSLRTWVPFANLAETA